MNGVSVQKHIIIEMLMTLKKKYMQPPACDSIDFLMYPVLDIWTDID